MKKITAIVLSLVALLSVGNIPAFASSVDGNELNQERCTKNPSRRWHISEETKSSVRKEAKTIREQNPTLSNQKICEIVGKKFSISVSSVKNFILPPEEYENYQKRLKEYRDNNKEKQRKRNKQYYEKNKVKIRAAYKQYYEKNREKQKEYYRQYGKKIKEMEMKQREEWEKKIPTIQMLEKLLKFI